MAGNCDRNRVGCDGGGHRPNGFWQANAGSDFSVSGGGAGRDFAQSLPDPLLERSAANIQWKIASNTRLFDKADDLSNQMFKIAVTADEIGFAKTVLEVLHELVRIIPKEDGANTLFRGSNQHRTQRTFADSEADRCAGPTVAKDLRAHAEDFGGLFIEATIGVVARVVDRFRDRAAARQRLADSLGAMGAGEGFRCEADCFTKHAMKMKGAHAD